MCVVDQDYERRQLGVGGEQAERRCTSGAVYRIWILTPEEQALYGPKHWFQRW